MNRRSFFGWLSGVLGSAAVAQVAESGPIDPTYTYDWNADPQYTDDPAFRKGLLYGGREVHRVLVDGEDVTDLAITKIRTGKDGYVEYFATNSAGQFIEQPPGEFLKVYRHGHVQYLHDTTTVHNTRYRTHRTTK